MRKISSLVAAGIACALLGVFAGTEWAGAQAQETNYLVIEEFQIAPDMSINESQERLSAWVRGLRDTGKHSSVRLFLHDWGSEISFYIVSETTDWNAVGDIFGDVIAVEPDLVDQPLGFSGHSDEILTEVPVE